MHLGVSRLRDGLIPVERFQILCMLFAGTVAKHEEAVYRNLMAVRRYSLHSPKHRMFAEEIPTELFEVIDTIKPTFSSLAS